MPLSFNPAQQQHEPAPEPESTPSAPGLLQGTAEQQAIWDALRTGTTHMIVDAVAGSGKSTSLVQGLMRMRDLRPRPSVCILAFNKHIADEMTSKLRSMGIDWVAARTYNSFGYGAIRRAYGTVQLDEGKRARLIKKALDQLHPSELPWDTRRLVEGAVRSLVGLCKAHLFKGDNQDQLDMLCARHDVTLQDHEGDWTDLVYSSVPMVLARAGAETNVVDFDDQVWLTVTKHLPVDKYDVLMADEVQDSNPMQQAMMQMACPTGRIVAVGDTMQAIYGFRGADTDAMNRLHAALSSTERGCARYPLTITRRCPKSHVELAQCIVPQIRALDDAPSGSVECLRDIAKHVRPGDLVLCRTNKPLVSTCFMLLKSGVKAVIRGRDVGKDLINLVQRLAKRSNDPTSVVDLQEELEAYFDIEQAKLLKLSDKGLSKLEALEDKVGCVTALLDGMRTVQELVRRIESLFADFEDNGAPRNAVVLGTVHRTKGLEASTVFVLEPRLLPHPMASQQWEREQELHLAYIAATRSKFNADGTGGRLVFVGPTVPAIYNTERAQVYAAGADYDWESYNNAQW